MTDNDIIKALECCASEGCKNCPYDSKCGISESNMPKDALDLINRQKVQIERLKAESNMADGYEDALVERTKSEAYKEFAEKLKEKAEFLKDDDDCLDLVALREYFTNDDILPEELKLTYDDIYIKDAPLDDDDVFDIDYHIDLDDEEDDLD